METNELNAFDEDEEEDTTAYAQLDELEKLETVIMLMEELGLTTLDQARTRFTVLERTMDTEA